MTQTPTEALAVIEGEIDQAFGSVAEDHDLRVAYAKFLGNEGSLKALMRRMPELAPADKKTFGQAINRVKDLVERAKERCEQSLREAARKRELTREPVDVTLPGRTPRVGRLHPLHRVLYDVIDIFVSMGFSVAEGPETDWDSNNFERLGFAPDHPALDMQDTFFLHEAPAGRHRPLLRTHTSTIQIREMLSHPPPYMIVAPGTVYRRDDDATHSPMFMQLEGLVVDKSISLAHLRGSLDAFAKRLFGDKVQTRLRGSYFPFTEPSVEMDASCAICEGKDRACRLCKGSGWLEVLGAGMVDPAVLSNCGIDPEAYTGFAFGLGIDRLAMIRYQIAHIGLMYENDVRFLESL
jgi:phenylalanyl-tRNA synthetase alpha chain